MTAIAKISSYISYFNELSDTYSSSYFTLLRRLRYLRSQEYTFTEAFAYGFFNPKLSKEDFKKICSHKTLRSLQARFYPPEEPRFVDKSWFYKKCLEHDIAIPKLFAVFQSGSETKSHTGVTLASKLDWERFIDSELPDDFVIKPSLSCHGVGVVYYCREGQVYVNSEGARLTAGEIYDSMHEQCSTFNSFVIQEMMSNVQALRTLSDSEYIQTLRIITVLDKEDNCHIFPYIKLIVGDNKTDNIDWGKTGNITCTIDAERGCFEQGYNLESRGRGLKTISHHPATNHLLKGFELPYWQETLDLVRKASQLFLPYRTYGWDVVTTPEGPKMLEGNLWYDPPALLDYSALLEALKRD